MTPVDAVSYLSAPDGSYTVVGEPLTGKSCNGAQYGICIWDNSFSTFCGSLSGSHGFYFTEPIPLDSPYIEVAFSGAVYPYTVSTLDYEGNVVGACSGAPNSAANPQVSSTSRRYLLSHRDLSAGPTPPPAQPTAYDYSSCGTVHTVTHYCGKH